MPPTLLAQNGRPVEARQDSNEVISRVVVADPSEDIAREEARMADSTPRTPTAPVRRQDFSNEKPSRRETKLGDYILGQTLGEGEFGKVKLGWKRDDGIQVAVKMIRRDKLDNQARLAKVYREISILRELNHPNIVRLHEMVEIEKLIGIILEYASGGELFDFILRERYLKDNSARRLFAQLVSAVGYLHKKGIVHRDLKLENLLLDRNNNIIVTDFGFANTFDPNDELDERIEGKLRRRSFVKKHNLDALQQNGFRRGDLMTTSCGSPCYAAPELVINEGIYTGRKVDVWSCGVILYAMLAGYLPFDDDPANPEGDNITLLYKYIMTAPLVFPEHVTPHARDILRRILVPRPEKRADLFEVARHSWLTEYAHLVEFITSNTTTSADVAKATMSSDGEYSTQPLARSASVRETARQANTSSPASGLMSKHGKSPRSPDAESKSSRDTKRRTLQVEYTEPQKQTPRIGQAETMTSAVAAAAATQATPQRTRARNETQGPTPVTQAPIAAAPAVPTKNVPSPVRPGRDVPRSISDSTAFVSSQPSQTARPPTQGSMTNGSRLPSRGSYGQPVAAAVAPANAQGHFSQPSTTATTAYGSAPYQQSAAMRTGSSGYAQVPDPSAAMSEKQQRPHRRSTTLTNLGDRLFGRSDSTKRLQKQDRKYPPTSMKQPIQTEADPRTSTDSRRSFGFSRKGSDLQGQPGRSSRRFSFVPRFIRSQEDQTPPSTAPYGNMSSPDFYRPVDGAHETSTSNAYHRFQPSSAPAATSAIGTRTQATPNVYSSYDDPNVSAPQSRTQTPGGEHQYPDQWPLEPLPQSKNATVGQGGAAQDYGMKPNVQFRTAWETDQWKAGRDYSSGSSGPARRVMDFFRRRGRQKEGMA